MMELFMFSSIWFDLSFFFVGMIFWGLMIVSGLYFIVGLVKKSAKAFFISGLAFLIPSITLSSQEGYYLLFLLLPLLAFLLAFLLWRYMDIH